MMKSMAKDHNGDCEIPAVRISEFRIALNLSIRQ
jgi:hypothetical protein